MNEGPNLSSQLQNSPSGAPHSGGPSGATKLVVVVAILLSAFLIIKKLIDEAALYILVATKRN